MLQVTVLKLPAIPNPNRVKTNQNDIMHIGLLNLMGIINTPATGKMLACSFKHLMGYGTYAGHPTSVSLAVTISIPRSLLPILLFFGRGIDTMFPALPLSLPTTFPKLFAHTTRVGWSLYPSRAIMSETGRATGKGEKPCPPLAVPNEWPVLFPFIPWYCRLPYGNNPKHF